MFFYPATVHFQSCTLNVNKIYVVLCFRKLMCAFSVTCFNVRMCKISDKSDTFSLNYSNLGVHLLGHSVVRTILCIFMKILTKFGQIVRAVKVYGYPTLQKASSMRGPRSFSK